MRKFLNWTALPTALALPPVQGRSCTAEPCFDGPCDWRCTGLLAMARARRARRISWAQPRHGVVVRRGPRAPPAGSARCLARAPADCPGSCGGGCGGCARPSVGGLVCGRTSAPRRRRARLDRLGALSLALRPSPPRPFRHAGRTCWSFRMVVSDGGCPRRRPDVVAGPDAAVSPKRNGRGAGEILAGLSSQVFRNGRSGLRQRCSTRHNGQGDEGHPFHGFLHTNFGQRM